MHTRRQVKVRRRRQVDSTKFSAFAIFTGLTSCLVFHNMQVASFIISTPMRRYVSTKSLIRPVVSGRAFYHEKSCALGMSIADTPLGSGKGRELLDGLDVYEVAAKGDKHPLSVYGINSTAPSSDDNVLLLLHGRTWSSVPVYHLMGGPKHAEQGYESRSLMEALDRRNITPYTFDFRGFGGTPRDTEGVIPNRCVEDVETVLEWIIERHGFEHKVPSLLGWSQGALVAQLSAQKNPSLISKLILYGSIYDPSIRYAREPLYIRNKEVDEPVENTFDAAIEDFTIEGTIPPTPACLFAEYALLADPIKAPWKQTYQFNNCDPARIHIPTLVVSIICL